jgi:hypothetical protein
MTNAPADLLGLRTRLQELTGLSAVDVGIVGDDRHARSGGYHIGRSGLAAAGVWDTDYSVRLTRDRTGATESSSAMDVGAGWKQGRAVWLKWNNLLANACRSGEPALMMIRAINYSPDGKLRWRIDRQTAWRTESSSDTVDVHTHIEWYRDTEGRRQACLDRIAALAQQAITGQLQPQEDDVSAHLEAVMDAWRNGNQVAADGSNVEPVKWEVRRSAREAAADKTQAAILAAVQADATRDAAVLAAIQALASAGGVDSAPIVAAVNAVRDEAREQFAQLHDQLAAESSARQAAEARAAELDRALADALGKAAGQ